MNTLKKCTKRNNHNRIMHIFNPTVVLSKVMPSYVSRGWRVKKPFSELLPEVDAQGEQRELSNGKKRKVKQNELEWGNNKSNGRCEEEKRNRK